MKTYTRFSLRTLVVAFTVAVVLVAFLSWYLRVGDKRIDALRSLALSGGMPYVDGKQTFPEVVRMIDSNRSLISRFLDPPKVAEITGFRFAERFGNAAIQNIAVAVRQFPNVRSLRFAPNLLTENELRELERLVHPVVVQVEAETPALGGTSFGK